MIPVFPAWTGTGASARQLADLIADVDKYAEVETENALGAYFVAKRLLHIDAVPNRITLQPGDRPVFDGERWTVDDSERVKS